MLWLQKFRFTKKILICCHIFGVGVFNRYIIIWIFIVECGRFFKNLDKSWWCQLASASAVKLQHVNTEFIQRHSLIDDIIFGTHIQQLSETTRHFTLASIWMCYCTWSCSITVTSLYGAVLDTLSIKQLSKAKHNSTFLSLWLWAGDAPVSIMSTAITPLASYRDYTLFFSGVTGSVSFLSLPSPSPALSHYPARGLIGPSFKLLLRGLISFWQDVFFPVPYSHTHSHTHICLPCMWLSLGNKSIFCGCQCVLFPVKTHFTVN